MEKVPPTIDLIKGAKALCGVYENVVLTTFDDHVVRMSRMEKPYFWHFHPNSDEMFLGVEGVLILDLEDRRIELEPGQLFTVARGVRHRTLPATRKPLGSARRARKGRRTGSPLPSTSRR